jgi:hypothetical protein
MTTFPGLWIRKEGRKEGRFTELVSAVEGSKAGE